jgi:transposase InsO family protein
VPPVLPRAHPEYLAIVLDWFSRRVLSWGVSITMETSFCVETLEDALARHGKPDIFNTDQGSQFTGSAFTSVLASNGIAISMDSRQDVDGQLMSMRIVNRNKLYTGVH